MGEMFITPIQIRELSSGLSGTESAQSAAGSGITAFKGIFENAVNEVKATENNLTQQQYMLVTGETNDPSAVTVAAAEAQMSVEMLVALKNKALEAYNSLINMSV